eukprot:TRINITY_DN31969_c0_g1_i1.p1 TRINITY_DN31969_c0_g1~~TRINITY_DN31969_c0_g1_i1.p1  ORF type:complete len:359 (+),score=67.22 TRINITY_DN31969_c0_g1_i1:72-1148(+)
MGVSRDDDNVLPMERAKQSQGVVGDLLRKWQGQPPSEATRPALKDLLQLNTTAATSSHVRAGTCTAYGPRPCNEDAEICCCEWTSAPSAEGSVPLALFAVLDGHGGATVSEQVSARLGAVLSAQVAACSWESSEADRANAVRQAFLEVDAALEREDASSCERCGSTCCAAIVWPTTSEKLSENGYRSEKLSENGYRVLLANVGDSKGLLYRSARDQLVETVDHKPDDPAEKQRIRDAGGFVVPADEPQPARLDGILAMSRAFGNSRFKKEKSKGPELQKVIAVPDILELEANTGDVLILGCDGVFDVMQSSEVAALAIHTMGSAQADSEREAAASLVWAALKRDTQDNVTSLVIRIGQ